MLHVGQAAEKMRASGLDVRIVIVTDDIASAHPTPPTTAFIAGELAPHPASEWLDFTVDTSSSSTDKVASIKCDC